MARQHTGTSVTTCDVAFVASRVARLQDGGATNAALYSILYEDATKVKAQGYMRYVPLFNDGIL